MVQRTAGKHPLQRLHSPGRDLSAVLHSLGLLSFSYSFRHLIVTESIVNGAYGWHFQFLTIIGLALATATFAVGLLADITMSHRLFAVKNTLSVASAPMESLISLLYWGLRAIDPKLVLPDWAPPLPFAADCTFHLIPAMALAIDLLYFSPPWQVGFAPALGLSSVIAFGYWFWIERCYQVNKFYPYPIFDLLSTSQRIGLFAASALLMTLATSTLIWLYHLINGKDDGTLNKKTVEKAKSGNVKGE